MNTQSVQCANVERVDRYAEKFHMGFSIVIIISFFWPEAQLFLSNDCCGVCSSFDRNTL